MAIYLLYLPVEFGSGCHLIGTKPAAPAFEIHLNASADTFKLSPGANRLSPAVVG